MNDFEPTRLTLARKRRGLTKKALADAAGVSSRLVSMYEQEKRQPTRGTLAKLARALDTPMGFFTLGQVDEIQPDAVSFRSLSRMTARQRDEALAAGTIALDVSRWMDSRFNLPAPDVPEYREAQGAGRKGAVRVAVALRRLWGLGVKPIRNMVHLLERQGVRVFSLSTGLDVDAFSFWRDGRPFIILNTQKSPERSRFDCAHELGHLIMHRHGPVSGRDVESEANAFASALLMPRVSVRARGRQSMSIEDVLGEKKYWGVSVAAMVYRLHDVGVLNDWSYRQMMIQVSKLGWRKTEPESQPRERSQVIAKAIKLLRDKGINTSTIAQDLCISPRDLHHLMFGLTMVAVQGGSQGSGSDHPPPKLRVVGGSSS